MSLSDTLRRAIAAHPGLGLDGLMPHVPEAENREQVAKLLSAMATRGDVLGAGEPRAYTYTITEAGAARADDDPTNEPGERTAPPRHRTARKPAAKVAKTRARRGAGKRPRKAKQKPAVKRGTRRPNGHAAVVSNTGANQRQVAGDHYRRLDPQPWDVITAWGLGFLAGNVVKYVARAPAKGGVEDLQKARHYLDKLIEQAEAA